MGVIKLIFDIIEGILSAVIEGIFDCLNTLTTKERKTELNARFLPASELLSSGNKGFCLDGKKCLSIHDSCKNSLVIGATGNFKSSGILIPSILRMSGYSSLVITDFSGELLQKCSGKLLKDGYHVMQLKPDDPYSSEGYNPVPRLKGISEMQKLAKLSVISAMGANSKDPFWNFSAEAVISLMLRYLIGHTESKYWSLHNVYHLISVLGYAPEKIDHLFVNANDPLLLAEYKSFIGYGDKVLASIIATCRAALSLFGTDPNIALVTCHDTIDFEQFRNKKIALFINTPTRDMRYYSLFTSLFLEQFFGSVMSSIPDKGALPIFFLIDEASSLYFPSLQIVCSNIRKHLGGIMQIYQSAAQIVDLYGQPVAKAITENSFSRVYMSNQPMNVAQELEATLGKFEYLDANNVRHTRSLMTASEIRESSDSLIFCGNNPAIKTPVIPYFKQSRLNKLTQLPPYMPANKLPYTTPPLQPID